MAPNGNRARHHEVSTNKTNSLRMRALSQNLQRVPGDMQPAAFKIRYSNHFGSRKAVKPLKLLNDIIQANLEKETFPKLTIHAILCHQLREGGREVKSSNWFFICIYVLILLKWDWLFLIVFCSTSKRIKVFKSDAIKNTNIKTLPSVGRVSD